jgi:hypothetical protein
MTRNTWIFVALIAISAVHVSAQNLQVSAIGGLGVASGSGQRTSFAGGGGASAGWLLSERSGIRFDYFYADVRAENSTRHFVTGSYVLQQRSGRTRPFLQIGGGLVRSNRKDNLNSPSGGSNDFAGLVGAGVTIDIGRTFFVRPEFRTYWYAGPTVAVLPGVSVGWHF